MICKACGTPNPRDAAACDSCGRSFAAPVEEAADAPETPATPAPRGRVIVGMRPGSIAEDSAPEGAEPDHDPEEEPLEVAGLRVPRGLAYLLSGIPLALVVSFACCGLGWMFKLGASLLFHESGHFFVAVLFGHPAIPSAGGVTHIYEQKPLLAAAVCGALVFGAWRFRETRPVAALFGALALVYVPLAASASHMNLVLFAGHGAEVAFGTVFLWRALAGGFVQELERPLYAMLGWMLIGRNVALWSAIAFGWGAERAVYESIAIAGDNDMVRIARAIGWDLSRVALVTLVYTIALPAATLSLWWFAWRRPADRARFLERLSLGPARGAT